MVHGIMTADLDIPQLAIFSNAENFRLYSYYGSCMPSSPKEYIYALSITDWVPGEENGGSAGRGRKGGKGERDPETTTLRGEIGKELTQVPEMIQNHWQKCN